MDGKIKTLFLNMIAPTISFIILGLLFFGIPVVSPTNPFFFFTIMGISAILFYGLIIQFGMKAFISLGLLFSLLMIVVFYPTTDLIVNLKNLNWFVMIGVLAFSISIFEKRSWYLNSKIWIVISWVIGFISGYIIMNLMSLFIYQLHRVNDQLGFLFYIKQSIKIGLVLGVGVGFGNLLTQTLNQSK